MGRYIIITKLVIFGAFLLSLDSLFLIGSFYWKVRSLSGACYIVITRFVISCRFIISGGLFTGRFAVRYREIRFSIGSLPRSLQ